MPTQRIAIDATPYRLVVGLIHTKSPDGSPALVKIIRDQDVIDLAGGEEFMTMYVPATMVSTGGDRPPAPPPIYILAVGASCEIWADGLTTTNNETEEKHDY